MNPQLLPGLGGPTNIWPGKVSVQKVLYKTAANLAATTFTCSIQYDPDFLFSDVNSRRYVFVTKISGCVP